MPVLRFWVKLLLFISAYTPLFLILIIKYIDILNIWFYIFIGIIIILNLIIVILFKFAQKYERREIKVKKASNETSNALNYVIAYIIAFIGFKFETWQDWLIFFILIFIIFFIYTNSNLIYINPILNIFGYKIYNVITINEEQLIILSKRNKIIKNSKIYIKNISEDIYLEAKSND